MVNSSVTDRSHVVGRASLLKDTSKIYCAISLTEKCWTLMSQIQANMWSKHKLKGRTSQTCSALLARAAAVITVSVLVPRHGRQNISAKLSSCRDQSHKISQNSNDKHHWINHCSPPAHLHERAGQPYEGELSNSQRAFSWASSSWSFGFHVKMQGFPHKYTKLHTWGE